MRQHKISTCTWVVQKAHGKSGIKRQVQVGQENGDMHAHGVFKKFMESVYYEKN